MPSAIIHRCVNKRVEEKLNKYKEEKDKYLYDLGSIAPDISKQINQHKKESHFLYNTKEDVPNIELFTTKYQNFKNNDFNLGYYIHLYTDKIWFDEFLEKLTYSNSIKLLDGTILATTHDEIRNLIYKDYTNLNIKLIDEYTIDLSLFYED